MIKRHIDVIKHMIAEADSKLIYLAAPYSSLDKTVIKKRMDTFREAIADLTQAGLFVVSPLEKHYSLFAGDLKRNIDSDWNFWSEFSEELMGKCGVMVVLAFEGYEHSSGVSGEMELARGKKLPTMVVYE